MNSPACRLIYIFHGKALGSSLKSFKCVNLRPVSLSTHSIFLNTMKRYSVFISKTNLQYAFAAIREISVIRNKGNMDILIPSFKETLENTWKKAAFGKPVYYHRHENFVF